MAEILLLIGPTGAGKTPFGSCLAHYGCRGRKVSHFDFGEELRCAVSGGGADMLHAGEREFLQQVLANGALLENERFGIALKILRVFVDRENLSAHDLLLLNGLPRHVDQARALEESFAPSAIVLLDCDAHTVYARIQNNTGGDRSGRIDDSVELIARKLETFRERTLPLISFYEGRGRPIIKLSVGCSTTASNLCAKFEEAYFG